MSGVFLVMPGRFLVISKGEVHVHLLDAAQETAYWKGIEIAETRTRDPHTSRLYVMRQTFRCDAQAALPAPSFESLAFYMEHYEGLAQDEVRMIAAVILSGQQFKTDQDGGGQRVPVTDLPHPPGPPAGATFKIPTPEEMRS